MKCSSESKFSSSIPTLFKAYCTDLVIPSFELLNVPSKFEYHYIIFTHMCMTFLCFYLLFIAHIQLTIYFLIQIYSFYTSIFIFINYFYKHILSAIKTNICHSSLWIIP